VFRTIAPFLRTIRWWRPVVASVLLAAWHVAGHVRVHRALAELAGAGWPTSRRELLAPLAEGLSPTNLPSVVVTLARELRGTRNRRRGPFDSARSTAAPGRATDFQFSAKALEARFRECGRGGVLSHPIPFLRYARLRNQVDDHAAILAALAKARPLADTRPPAPLLAPGSDPEGWAVPITDLAVLLQYQALVAAQDGHPDVATAAIGDILLVARAFEEFPDEHVQKTRGEIVRIAARTTAMVVSMMSVDDARLAWIEAGFARVPEVGPFRRAMEGHVADWIGRAMVGPRGVADLIARAPGTPSEGVPLAILSAVHWAGGLHLRDRGRMLESFADETRSIDTAASAAVGRDAEAQVIQSRLQGARLAALCPATQMSLEAIPWMRAEHLETLADARAAVLVCAIERHRLAHDGELPADLSGLSADVLPEGKIPVDPFDDCPLRLQRLCTAYCVQTGRGRDYDSRDSGAEVRLMGLAVRPWGVRRNGTPEDNDRRWWGGLLVDR